MNDDIATSVEWTIHRKVPISAKTVRLIEIRSPGRTALWTLAVLALAGGCEPKPAAPKADVPTVAVDTRPVAAAGPSAEASEEPAVAPPPALIEHTLPRSDAIDLGAGVLAVSIRTDGSLEVDGRPLADDAQLVELARRRSGYDPGVRAVIQADADTVYQRLITVMDLLRQGGVTNYAFAVPR